MCIRDSYNTVLVKSDFFIQDFQNFREKYLTSFLFNEIQFIAITKFETLPWSVVNKVRKVI